MFFIIAILFKESAYVTPFLAVALLWYEKKLSTHWKTAFVFFGVLAVAVAYRTWALQGTGFKFGSNGTWFQRMISEIGLGSLATPLIGLHLLPFAIGLVLMAILNRKHTKVWACYAAAAVACYLTAEFRSEYFGSAAGQILFLLAPWRAGIAVLALVWMWHRAIVRRERLQIFAYLWVLIAYLPILRAPVTSHALYFMALPWALFGACAALDAQPYLSHCYKRVTAKISFTKQIA